ncbi:hypothetical protein BD324DRAFT_579948 [Kockovaella imperatae]|uniref:Nucleotide-diphospho-sugar transferase n=1 Tax=Kockovaella imperatae TaxID=4999 RepID=A0A1Y1UH85_9TREE|nr:hypothetical protein BD324DRAFT_579948 [Kockovaella imperatae]ORX36844.1 hypothetical protein BD324DRAFT_579948 [Kockovaella imperatae]
MLKGGLPRFYVPLLEKSQPRDLQSTPLSCRSITSRALSATLLLALGVILGSTFSVFSSYQPPPLAVALPPIPTNTDLPVPSLPLPREPIPNIVHYVYGLDPDSTREDFPYYAYLAMRSALVTLKPEKVLFHCLYEPRGYWWSRVVNWEGWVDDEGQRKGLVEIHRARDVTTIGSHKNPVTKFAHKADIIRLEVLLQHGGIYLDIDTFILRSFSKHSLLAYDTVMAMEAAQWDLGDSMDPKGLCNGIIVARKGATFLERWLETYETFNGHKWADHSVHMPWVLAKLYPETITVLSNRAFFWPLWISSHISLVYKSTDYDFEASGQLAYHAWESKAKSHLRALNPSTIQSITTSFTIMARKYREHNEERNWKAQL